MKLRFPWDGQNSDSSDDAFGDKGVPETVQSPISGPSPNPVARPPLALMPPVHRWIATSAGIHPGWLFQDGERCRLTNREGEVIAWWHSNQPGPVDMFERAEDAIAYAVAEMEGIIALEVADNGEVLRAIEARWQESLADVEDRIDTLHRLVTQRERAHDQELQDWQQRRRVSIETLRARIDALRPKPAEQA